MQPEVFPAEDSTSNSAIDSYCVMCLLLFLSQWFDTRIDNEVFIKADLAETVSQESSFGALVINLLTWLMLVLSISWICDNLSHITIALSYSSKRAISF